MEQTLRNLELAATAINKELKEKNSSKNGNVADFSVHTLIFY